VNWRGAVRRLIGIPGDEVTRKRDQAERARPGQKARPFSKRLPGRESFVAERARYMLNKRLRRRPKMKPEMPEIRTDLTTDQPGRIAGPDTLKGEQCPLSFTVTKLRRNAR
jgi:hypothetical protein